MMKGIGSSEGYGIGRVLTIKEINLEFTPKDNFSFFLTDG